MIVETKKHIGKLVEQFHNVFISDTQKAYPLDKVKFSISEKINQYLYGEKFKMNSGYGG